jgi:AcrR family transcriptional regulator
MDGAATKEKLERAALRLFLRKGVDGTSMREVVQEAGFSLGAFYNHFASKEELAATLFLDAWYTMGTELRRRTREAGSFQAQLQAVASYMFEFFDEDPDLVGYAFLSRQRFILQVNVRLPNPHLVIKVFVIAAMARGEARKMDSEIATQCIMGTVIQTVDARMLGLITGPLKARAKEVGETLYRALRA